MSSALPSRGPDLDGYDWVRALGAGGFADVHLYRQHSPARDVAVKLLREPGSETGRAAMAREADALAAVAGHPAVVALYGSGTTRDGRPYLALEYCPVADLSEQVRRQPMAVAVALDLMIQVAAATETLHRAGLVHRDLKPSNLMLNRWGRPVLADFGSVLPVDAVGEGGGFSLLWAPPEQHAPRTPAHPSQDVWGLAVTTWGLLTGHSPFEEPGGDNTPVAVAARVQAGRRSALGRPDAPEELGEALRAALAQEPNARGSAAEFAGRLQAVQERMRLPRTPANLPAVTPASALVLDEQRTRVRGIPSIEADPAPAGRPPAGDGRAVLTFDDSTFDPDSTLPPSGATGPVPSAPKARPARRGVRGWVVALLVVAAVAITAAGVTAGLLGTGGPVARGTASAPVQPRDPVAEPPAPVAGLAGKLTRGRVFWTWQPSAEQGVRYIFTITRPGRDQITRETTLTGADVEAVAGDNCIEVAVTTANGRESSSVTSCVKAR